MHKVEKCAKCGGTDIVRVPGEMVGFGGGNYIRVGMTPLSNIPVSRYVCTNCGFIEEWVDSLGSMGSVVRKWKPKKKP